MDVLEPEAALDVDILPEGRLEPCADRLDLALRVRIGLARGKDVVSLVAKGLRREQAHPEALERGVRDGLERAAAGAGRERARHQVHLGVALLQEARPDVALGALVPAAGAHLAREPVVPVALVGSVGAPEPLRLVDVVVVEEDVVAGDVPARAQRADLDRILRRNVDARRAGRACQRSKLAESARFVVHACAVGLVVLRGLRPVGRPLELEPGDQLIEVVVSVDLGNEQIAIALERLALHEAVEEERTALGELVRALADVHVPFRGRRAGAGGLVRLAFFAS